MSFQVILSSFHPLLLDSFERLLGWGNAVRIRDFIQMASHCQNLAPQALPEMPGIPLHTVNDRRTEVCTLSYPDRIVLSCVNSTTSSYPSATVFPLWVWRSGLRNAVLAAIPSPRGHSLFNLKRQTDLSIEYFQYTSFSKMYVMNFVFKIL